MLIALIYILKSLIIIINYSFCYVIQTLKIIVWLCFDFDAKDSFKFTIERYSMNN